MTALAHRFGPYGGQYVPETLMPALSELESAWLDARDDPGFGYQLADAAARLRRAPLAAVPGDTAERARGPAESTSSARTSTTPAAHKINNALGQALLAKRMGKERIIAETGAGQHGVATATACALLELECVVYMGTEDMRRQRPNVERMQLLGARVVGVDARRVARSRRPCSSRDPRLGHERPSTHYIIGSCVGPAPYPALVRDLQRVIGDEARAQILERAGRLPDARHRLRRRRLQRDRHLRSVPR